jgi:two-component system, sensor histidine kinase
MILQQELREGLRTSAAIAAETIDPRDVTAIRGAQDLWSPAQKRLFASLQTIRARIPNVRYAYIMRRTDDPLKLAFVADADALSAPEELDRNRNGIIEPDEEGSHPGDLYDITDIPALHAEAFEHPTVDEGYTVDQWGTLVSGYAPIRDSAGRTIAVLGIDMVADDFIALSERIFSPLAFVLVILAGLAIAALILWESARRRMAVNLQMEAERSSLLQLTLHRIGTPLTIFKWSLEMLADCMTGQSCSAEDVQNHIDRMRVGIHRMDDTVRMLLEAERVELGSVSYSPQPTPLRSLLAEVELDVANDLLDRTQHLTILPTCECTITVDPQLLRGILREIIENASVYSPDGATITVEARCTPHHVEFSIQDQGCGIPTADRQRIFQKFGRARNAHLCHPNGAGLGLYIAHGIIERAGGTITLESEEDKGTTVRFSLPTG